MIQIIEIMVIDEKLTAEQRIKIKKNYRYLLIIIEKKIHKIYSQRRIEYFCVMIKINVFIYSLKYKYY